MVCGLPPAPVFVAEGKPAPAIQFTFAETTLGPVRKLLVLSAVTRELNEATPGTAEVVIGRILADRSSASIDLAAFGSGARRRGQPSGFAERRDANPAREHGWGGARLFDDGRFGQSGRGDRRRGECRVLRRTARGDDHKARMGPRFDYDVIPNS